MTAVAPCTREARHQEELGREAWREGDNEETRRVVEALVRVAEEAERAPAQVAPRRAGSWAGPG
ncbi:hypothetical protein ACFWVP_19070 [Streptomyces sp. NPDC058637]|uniref:hypothetical protein n=1 Tax=Streptomyces sp. NPDC058637 TaxID=3346569 RepID=UPI003660E1C8